MYSDRGLYAGIVVSLVLGSAGIATAVSLSVNSATLFCQQKAEDDVHECQKTAMIISAVAGAAVSGLFCCVVPLLLFCKKWHHDWELFGDGYEEHCAANTAHF